MRLMLVVEPLRHVVRRAEQAEVGSGGVVESLEADPVHRRVGARAGREHDVADGEALAGGAARADADDGLDVVLGEPLA